MNLLELKSHSVLLENAALSKGSQTVLKDKNLVQSIASRVRQDSRFNPSVFPPNSYKKFKNAPDEEVAQWFLENLDNIEKQGYEGTVYSKNGVNNAWIARKYAEGKHNWEDIIGVLNMNLRDWYALKNRDMLEPQHADLQKFGSIRDLGKYLSTHYHGDLEQVRDAAKQAAIAKLAKKANLVDNDDYKIYTVFNWAAARSIGLGTQWCTANSESDTNYKSYSSNAMLFQLFPKEPEMVQKKNFVTGKEVKGPEKYQFDAGGPYFKDIADENVDREMIRKKFPYIYTDLVSALEANKVQLQTALDELSKDPALDTKETKVNFYDINNEIKKLKVFITAGYFTDKVRPAPKPAPEPEAPAEQPPQEIGHEERPNQGEPQMEEVDKDVKAMLANLKKYDILKESMAPVLEKKKDGKKPEWLLKAELNAEEKEGKKEVDEGKWSNQDKPEDHFKSGMDKMKDKLTKKDGKKDEKKDVKEAEECKVCHETPCECDKGECDKEEVKESADQEVLNWMKRFANLGNMKGYGR